MRWTAFLFLFVTLLGCTTQASGQRCQQNSDCNAETDLCRNESAPERECNGLSCICCPANAAAAAAITACLPRVGRTDSGTVTDTGAVADTGSVVDTGVDAGADTDTGADTDAGPSAD